MSEKKQNKSNVYAFGTILFWASAFVCTKVALKYFTAPSIGVLRYVTASIFFLIIAFTKRIGLPKRRDIPKFLLSGALGFTLYMILFNGASRSLSSATGSIIIATAPVITALLAYVIFHEKIKALGWIAIAIEFIGILILTLWNGVLSINSGVFWMLGAALCISAYNLFQRYYRTNYTALQSTAYNIFAGTLLLLIYLPNAAVQFVTAPVKLWLVVIYMGVFPSAVAYLLWGKALTIAVKTSDVTNFMFVTPLLATIMSFLVIRDTPSVGTLTGGGIILVGLLLFQKANAKDNAIKNEDSNTIRNNNEAG